MSDEKECGCGCELRIKTLLTQNQTYYLNLIATARELDSVQKKRAVAESRIAEATKAIEQYVRCDEQRKKFEAESIAIRQLYLREQRLLKDAKRKLAKQTPCDSTTPRKPHPQRSKCRVESVPVHLL